LLTFIPGSYSESGAEFEIGTSKVTAASAEDLFWQATTRGGRQIDAINAGKAQFKDTAGTVGDVAIGAGTGLAMAGGLSGNRDMQGAAAIIGLIGLMAKAAEAAARPEADVRYWDNLPAQILIATTEIRPGSAVRGRFLPAGSPVTLKVSTATSQSPSGRACSLVWMRSPSAFAVPDSAPGAVAAN
jgi:hypothetical protein